MKTKILLIVCFIAFLATMQSCIDPYCPVSKCVNGNGSIVSEEFLLDNFNSVVSKTVVDIEIIQGEEQKVLVEGHENMIHELWLRVSNGRLDIDLPEGCYNNFELKVYITVPEVKNLIIESTGNILVGQFVDLQSLYLRVDGTGDIISDGTIGVDGQLQIEVESTGIVNLDVTANEVETYIDGTGNVTLNGSCKSQFIESKSTGIYRAYDFDSEECRVFSNGVGDVHVYVTKTLNVTINSVGSVYYKGNPSVKSYDNGVGDLIPVN